ncbi:Uncharacterized membrane protein YeiB [Glycomyces sambucus]|uniref:Uncharacterized membrane protein YeiB n=1 Tax=Glycomyces sambucus TaxID=380244 RepID=A0A1G9MY90_9ACTN|nr:DUF418 domain-containing protein [Glycomyces sambucus]SDL78981.1 Uncharacterized membrane protein YeiB [Glycomyces sambucus]
MTATVRSKNVLPKAARPKNVLTKAALPIRPAAAPPGERTLAPDLGRGFMLLAIALAHAHLVLYVADYRPTAVDQAAVLIRELLVDDRARPMFFLLFGYGLVQLTTRLASRGAEWTAIRPLLRRRGWWLLLFGFAHAAVIGVDIVSVYGFALLCFAGLLVRSDRVLVHVAAWTTLALAAFFLALSASEATSNALMGFDLTAGSTDPAEMASWRFGSWAFVLIAFGWQVLPAMTLGIWAARRRILESPGRHLPLLRRTAATGIGLAVAGGLPWALVSSRLIEPGTLTSASFGAVHAVTGLAGGVGAIALIALVADRKAPGRFATAVAALGQRSLTFYMFQSVVFLAVFAPFTTGLGARTGFLGAALAAVATWLLSLALADAMRRRAYRGPAEILLRRLTYGRVSPAPHGGTSSATNPTEGAS